MTEQMKTVLLDCINFYQRKFFESISDCDIPKQNYAGGIVNGMEIALNAQGYSLVTERDKETDSIVFKDIIPFKSNLKTTCERHPFCDSIKTLTYMNDFISVLDEEEAEK